MQELDNLVINLDKSRVLAKYSGALMPLFYTLLYPKTYQMTEEEFASFEIGAIFKFCKNNKIGYNILCDSLNKNLTPIKNSEIFKNYDNLYHKSLLVKITKDNVDDYDKEDIFNPFPEVKLLEDSLKICEELRLKYGDSDSVYNEDLERLATRKEIVQYKQSKLKKFKEKYASILNNK